MGTIKNIGSLKEFDQKIENYKEDGYEVAILFKDKDGIIVKLRHPNNNIIMAQYDYSTGEYTIR